MYARAEYLTRNNAEIIKPSERLTVPEAAAKYVRLSTGAYSPDVVHYMIEPGETLTSRLFRASIFAGPARTGKTQMYGDNWMAHNIMCDPNDMMLVFPIAELAAKFSKKRVDKLHRYSPEIRAELGTTRGDDNVGEKRYKKGNSVSFVSPTKNTLAMQDLCSVLLSDYDRYDDDIGGDGPAFNMGYKRTETFLSRGMTAAESSPSKPITDAHWRCPKDRPHEAPPSLGILGLYNEGDRRRLYGQCQHCEEYWMQSPAFEDLYLPEKEEEPDREKRIAKAGLVCPKCGCINGLDTELAIKASAKWLKEGENIDKNGQISGEGRRSLYASFWMPGWHAAFLKWHGLIRNYVRALDRFELSGDEGGIKVVTNIDCGAPYLEKSRQSSRSAAMLEERAETDLDKLVVPVGVRYLVAVIDCQKYSFVVQVQGFGVDQESWIIDRFEISVSERTDEDGHPLILEPASYKEDWVVLRDRVINRTYTTADDRQLRVRQTGLDMHGVPGLSPNAYAFYKKMRKEGFGDRFRLLRGDNVKNQARVRETFPDQPIAGKQKKKVVGDIPVMQLNTEKLKDIISARLDRPEPGPGYIHFPSWLPSKWYEEVVSEIRTEKGWEKDHDNIRNEAWDLLVYALALSIDPSKPRGLNAEKINWEKPPSWAAEWDTNSNIVRVQEDLPPKKQFNANVVRRSDDPYL